MLHKGLTRFQTATAIAVLAAAGGCFFLGGAARGWFVASVAVCYAAAFALGVSFIRFRFFSRAICRGKPGLKRLALTFDDGPDSDTTPVVLDMLKERGVKATFFLVGRKVLLHPALARRVVDEGHVVGNHGFSHAWWTNFLYGRRLLSELSATQDAISGATGAVPRCYRPPMGLTNPHVPAALRRLGLLLVGWDVRSFDLSKAPSAAVGRVVHLARDGSIILLHDAGLPPARAGEILTTVIERLKNKGFNFVTLGSFIEDTSEEGR